jgi:putative spermidine/putrescine transport system substrate-binding protein
MRKLKGRIAALAWCGVVALSAGVVFAGCGSSSDNGGSGEALSKIDTAAAKQEGEVNLVNWAGYVEDGTDYGPKYDWVTPFEKQTGCNVNYKEAGTSDQMVDLMRTGQYDGVSASGNASGRLVAGGDVDPVNVDLIDNYKDVFPDLKDQPYNTFDGTHYGVPHGRGANLLMWNSDVVKPAPTSWDVLLDPNKAAQYKGKISVYDDPIYIADAAVYLKAHQPDLGIDNPYELDEDQFNAAVDLLKQQRDNVGEYWSNATKQIQAFTNGDDEVGTTWQYQYFLLKGEGEPVASSPASQGFVPDEGATGWSDTWMISSTAAHPNCMYLWMNWVLEPKVQAQIAEFFGEAPANSKACDFTSDPNFCDSYHAGDPGFWNRVYYWNVPVADCGDDRGEVCKDYNDWVTAWTEIKG